MGEGIERFLDWAAEPSGLSGGKDLRVFWNSVTHTEDAGSADDRDWANSEPDPDAP
ncbi:MAG: hypothetical protein JF618_06810 [Leifsonia sp.]|nr:hypothetical protein [Leifsonia sp.]